jgi:hypothetical protein
MTIKAVVKSVVRSGAGTIYDKTQVSAECEYVGDVSFTIPASSAKAYHVGRSIVVSIRPRK